MSSAVRALRAVGRTSDGLAGRASGSARNPGSSAWVTSPVASAGGPSSVLPSGARSGAWSGAGSGASSDAVLAEVYEFCRASQEDFDATAQREVLDDIEWIPPEMIEVVKVAFGCPPS